MRAGYFGESEVSTAGLEKRLYIRRKAWRGGGDEIEPPLYFCTCLLTQPRFERVMEHAFVVRLVSWDD